MEFTIATLNEVLLPPFLFLITFCFLCCQLPRPRYATAHELSEASRVVTPQPAEEEEIQPLTEQESSPTKVPAVEELACDEREAPVVFESATREPHPLTTEVVEAEPDLKPEPGASQQPSLYALVITVLDGLSKREARKLMGGLLLQQKRNGVELSTELMVASIRREFKASPERVIEVIRLRLPELLSNDAA